MSDFEERLAELCSESGAGIDEMISAMELRIMALREEQEAEDDG